MKLSAKIRKLIEIINGTMAFGTDYVLTENSLQIGLGKDCSKFPITKQQFKELKKLGY